jgi:hypothetical protein
MKSDVIYSHRSLLSSLTFKSSRQCDIIPGPTGSTSDLPQLFPRMIIYHDRADSQHSYGRLRFVELSPSPPSSSCSSSSSLFLLFVGRGGAARGGEGGALLMRSISCWAWSCCCRIPSSCSLTASRRVKVDRMSTSMSKSENTHACKHRERTKNKLRQ